MTLDELVEQAARVTDALSVAEKMGCIQIVEARRSLIEDMASQVQALTCRGGLLQVALAWQAVECVVSWLPDPAPHHAANAGEELRRLLFSIRVLLEKLGGEPMHERISSFYMPADDNPLRMVDEALAAVDRGEVGD